MGRPCSVCSHPERAAIDAALVAGAEKRGLARTYALSEDAVGRHFDAHLAAATEAAKRGRERDIDAEIERLFARLEAIAERAERNKDDRVAIAAAREIRSTVELLARLRGELRSPAENGAGVAMVNVALLVQSPQWQRLSAVVLGALADEPRVRYKVLAAIRSEMLQLEGAGDGAVG